MAAANLMTQCSAKSKQRGTRCKQSAIRGGTVCRYHGGAAPQVQQAARVRLAALVDPSIDRLARLLKEKTPAVALGAVKDVLDRNGLKAPDQLHLTGALGVDEIARLPTDELKARLIALVKRL